MKVAALKQLQAGNPSMYDPIAIDMAAMQAIGWGNPQQFMAPPSAQQQPPPELMQIQAKIANEKKEADAKAMLDQARAAEIHAKIAQPQPGQQGGQMDPQMMANMIKLKEIDMERQQMLLEATNRKRDRESDERLAAVKFAEDMAKDPQGLAIARSILQPGLLQRLEGNENPITPGSAQPIE